jgi:hypothetical protein
LPPAGEVQRSLWGAWRMMMGHADGLRAMDLTVDGFWNSFFAIIVALPALAFSWHVAAGRLAAYDGDPGERMSLVVRFAIVDLGSWILPLLALALLARRARIADRFVHYVVATNWASAVIIWIMLVPQIMRLIWPNAEDPITLVALVLFLLTLFLLWRVTNIAIGKGPAMGTAVFSGMFAGSLVVLFTLQPLLGLEIR